LSTYAWTIVRAISCLSITCLLPNTIDNYT